MVYLASGALAKEQLGTDTPIFNKLFYNVRGQLAEIRESTSYTGATDTSGDRGAIINHYSNQAGCRGASCNATDNNGNLRRQEVYIPRPDSTDWDNFAQFYEYDALNRLQSVRENENGGAVQWQQQYVYDRYGNRTIDYNHTSSDIPRPQFSVNPSNNRLGVPSGQTGVLSYDAAGNLTNDTYTGNGSRIYDAENRMIAATESISGQTSTYTYDGDGQRVRRSVNGQETWQVYGMGGELLAEYDITYRNVAHHTVRQVNLSKEYGYRNGQLLITAAAPASVLCGTYDACGASPPEEIGPIGELESGAGGPIQWLVTDPLGTPRMIFNQSGSLAGVSRHDYLPFGEELFAGTGGRTTTQGYSATDGVRQKFTQKERDNETGLDWFGPGRYYSSTQGRFTSVDPSGAGAQAVNPQSLNRYTYTLNRPTIAIDPDGLSTIVVTVTVAAGGGNPTASIVFSGKIGENGADAAVRYDGLAAGQGRDRMATYNDTPYGVYSFDGTQGGTADSRLGRGFGTGKIIITGEAGEIIESGRTLIRLHGGGTPLGDHAYDLDQNLIATQGCVRMHNGDVNGLIGNIGTARTNQDPLDRVFIGTATTLTTTSNQTDRNGSYVNPDLRLAMGLYSNEQQRQALITADANRRAEVQRQREEQQRQQQERQRQREQRRHPAN
jgi:RHS repeat-associated protein